MMILKVSHHVLHVHVLQHLLVHIWRVVVLTGKLLAIQHHLEILVVLETIHLVRDTLAARVVHHKHSVGVLHLLHH
jgi:phosphoglycerol transferase MdoB-like AlkP superfamily enzyme